MKYYYKSRIRYSEVGEDKKLTLESLINYFQDCSTFQSEDLGFGVEHLEEINRVWVLSFWQIEIKEYPALAENIRVGTWAYDFSRCIGMRNFIMENEANEVIVCANSIWTYLESNTGHPARMEQEMAEAYGKEEKYDMDYDSRKLHLPDNGKEMVAFAVERHHLDTNHHVNNGQYVKMASDYLDSCGKIKKMQAEYKKSALLGDIIVPWTYEEAEFTTVALKSDNNEVFAIVRFWQEG